VQAASDLQQRIVSFMLEELDRGDDGCLGMNQYECDFDPHEAVERILSTTWAMQEQDFQTCVDWTGDPGWNEKPIGQIDLDIYNTAEQAKLALINAPGIDPSASLSPPSMQSLASPGATSSALVNADGPIKRSAIGQVVTGGDYFGDPDFAGGGYTYGGYWKVTPQRFTKPGPSGKPEDNTACELDGEVHGELHARVDLLRSIGDGICNVFDSAGHSLDDLADKAAVAGVNFKDLVPYLQSGFSGQISDFCSLRYRMRHLADAHVTATAVPNNNSWDGDLFFGGQQLWKDGGQVTLPNINVSWPSTPDEVPGLNDTVIVVVVPVTFEVKGEIQYGANATVQLASYADSVDDCKPPNFGVTAQFTPWLTADAIGSVAIGVDWAQAGVRGKLRVIDASLPFTASAGIQQSNNLPQLGAHTDATLDLRFLQGSMSAFAELKVDLGPLGSLDEEVEHEFYRNDGIHKPITIFQKDLPLIALPAFTQQAWSNFQQSSPLDPPQSTILLATPLLSADFTQAPLGAQADLSAWGLGFSRASPASVQTGPSSVDSTPKANQPRIGSTGAGWGRGLVLEEQRTNFVPTGVPTNLTFPVPMPSITMGRSAPDGTATAMGYINQGIPDSNVQLGVVAQSPDGTLQSPNVVHTKWIKGNPAGSKLVVALFDGKPGGYYWNLLYGPSDWQRVSIAETGLPSAVNTVYASYEMGAFGIWSGANDIWGFQLENGLFPTELIETTTAAATRAGERLDVPDAEVVIDGGRIGMYASFVPKGARSAYTGRLPFWTLDATDYAYVDPATGAVVVTIGGTTQTLAAQPVTWNAGDVVELWLEAGGNAPTYASVRVNGAPATVIGTAASPGAILPSPVPLDVLCNGTSQQTTAWIQKLSFLRNGQRAPGM
jgi:hypothetical protein